MLISAGSPIELDVEIDGARRSFDGTVDRATDELITLRVPTGRRVQPFPVGTEIHVEAIERSRVVTFDAAVMALVSRDADFIVEVRTPAEVRTERRAWYRLPCALAVAVRWTGLPARSRLVTEDLGGGGIGLLTDEPHDIGGSCLLALELGDGRPSLDVRAEVVRCHALALGAPPRFRVGLAFDGLAERDRDRIVQFVFDRQRDARRRGRA